MRRRVGSASAAKVRFKVFGEYLTIWLTIKPDFSAMQIKNFTRLDFRRLPNPGSKTGTESEVPAAPKKNKGHVVGDQQ